MNTGKFKRFCPTSFWFLKLHYATFYGPTNTQRDRALDTRDSSLQELISVLDVL